MFAAPPVPSAMHLDNRKSSHWRPISSDTQDGAAKKVKASLAAFDLKPPRKGSYVDKDGKVSHKTKTRGCSTAGLGRGLNLDFSFLRLGDEDLNTIGVVATRCVAGSLPLWGHPICKWCNGTMVALIPKCPPAARERRQFEAHRRGIPIERDMDDVGVKEVLQRLAERYLPARARVELWTIFRPYALTWLRADPIPLRTGVEIPSLAPPVFAQEQVADPYFIRRRLDELCLAREEKTDHFGETYRTIPGDSKGLQITCRDPDTCHVAPGEHDLLAPFVPHEVTAFLTLLYTHHARTWKRSDPVVLVNTTPFLTWQAWGTTTCKRQATGMLAFFGAHRGGDLVRDPHPAATLLEQGGRKLRFDDVDLFVGVVGVMVDGKKIFFPLLIHPRSRLCETIGLPEGCPAAKLVDKEIASMIEQQCGAEVSRWNYFHRYNNAFDPTLDPGRITTTLHDLHIAIYSPLDALTGKLICHRALLDELNPEYAKQMLWIRGKHRQMMLEQVGIVEDMMTMIRDCKA